MKPSDHVLNARDYIRCDTAFPPQGWDVAWSASRSDDGFLVIDNRPMTVAPNKWPEVQPGYDFLVVRR